MNALPVAGGRQTSRALLRSLRRHPAASSVALAWTLMASTAVVSVPLLLGRWVDELRTGDAGDAVLLPAIAVVALLGAVFTALAQRAAAQLAAHVAAELREQVMNHVLGLEPALLESAGGGDVTSRVTDDLENFVQAVPTVAAVASAVATLGVSMVAVTSLDWRLSLAVASVVPTYTVALRLYLRRSGAAYARERQTAAERARVLLETLHGAPTVQAYGMASLQTSRVQAISQQALTHRLRILWLALWLTKAMNTAEAVGLSSVFLTGYFLVRADLVTLGSVTAAALLFHRLFDPLGVLLGSFDEVQRAHAALARVVGVTLLPLRPLLETRPPSGPVSLHVSGLHHSYAGSVKVLDNVDLTVPTGKSLAVVGVTGAGKSTLAAILAGMFPATAGKATLTDAIGPTDVHSWGSSPLANWIGMISQETHVFSGTLREDLTLAAPDAHDQALTAALHRAGAQAWLQALPHGLDTRVGIGGFPLTPVQTQQLALARLILRDPPFLVLDEATAEAGSAGARELEASASALLRGRTAVVVAHRLSQARDCDLIAVMNRGQIEELGTHAELVAADGQYARMWEAWSRR